VAVVCTTEFLDTARSVARMVGLPDYPFAVVDHPLGSRNEAELEEQADRALPQVEALLRGSGDKR